MRRCASVRTRTRPASRSTRRCFDVFGWLMPSASASSPTAHGRRSNTSSTARRCGSTNADHSASVTQLICQHMYIRVKAYASVGSVPERSLVDVTPSLLAALGSPGFDNRLAVADTRAACLLLIDALGWELLRD